MLITLLIIFVTIFCLVYLKFKNAFNNFKTHGIPHLPPTFPFGNMGAVITRRQCMGNKILEIYNELKPKGCKYAGLYFFTRRAFLMIDPKLVKSVLCTDFQYFQDRGIFYDEENDPVSAHLFSLSGSKWRQLRTKLTPAFTAGKVKYMFPSIGICGNEMVNLIEREIVKNAEIEIKDLLARFTTDVIGSCAFGLECNSLKNPDAEFRKMGKRAFTQTRWDAIKMVVMRSYPKIAKYLGFSVFAPVVSKFFQVVVEKTVDFREKNHVVRPDFLQLLIQLKNGNSLDGDKEKSENPITMNEIVAQAFIFFLAGFETTSTAMSFALLELALNPEIQTKARKEVRSVLRKHQNQMCYDAIIQMNYLDQIISESLRKYPPAPVYLRKCTQNYTIPDSDVIIEKGLSVLIPALPLHRDPEYFPNPLLFDPERFSDSNKYKIKDYTYIPFGDGPRICIGMRFSMVQAKFALALLLNKYAFSVNKKTPWPIEMETNGIIFTTKGGIWMDFEKVK